MNPPKRFRIVLAAALAIAAGLFMVRSATRGLPAQEGIDNFGKVNDRLYRGAQPDAAGLTNLCRLGVKSVINLRMPNDEWAAEAAVGRANGLLCTNINFHGVGRPTDEQVTNVLFLIESLPGPVFVHCEHGCDRTGTIIACYRIRHDHWTGDAALAEAKRYGMSGLEWGMRKFVTDFEKMCREARRAPKDAAATNRVSAPAKL